LRRKYNVGGIPVMGLRRSRLFFGFKIGALNFKKMLKFARDKCDHEASAGKCA
jgi:nucleoside-triphosphatase THEP1